MKRKYITALGCLLMALFAMNLTIISPLILEIGKTFSLSTAQSGLVFTFNFIGFVIFVLIGGVMADRVGKKQVLNVAVVGVTIALFCFAFSQNYAVLCAAAILMGGFGGVLESLVSALVGDINPENPGYYVNLTQIFFSIGAVIGPVAVGFAISGGVSWRTCYIVLGAVFVLMSIVFLPAKAASVGTSDIKVHKDNASSSGIADRAEASGGSRQLFSLASLFKNGAFLLLCISMMFYTGAEVGGWGWMCKLLEENLGYQVNTSGFAVAFYWIAMTVGRILCGELSRRFSLEWLIRGLAIAAALSTMLAAFVGSEAGMWIVVGLMGISYSSLFPFIIAYGTGKIKAPSGVTVSLLVASGGVGSMIVPYIMGLVGDYAGMAKAMLVPAGLLFMLSLIFFGFRRRKA